MTAAAQPKVREYMLGLGFFYVEPGATVRLQCLVTKGGFIEKLRVSSDVNADSLITDFQTGPVSRQTSQIAQLRAIVKNVSLISEAGISSSAFGDSVTYDMSKLNALKKDDIITLAVRNTSPVTQRLSAYIAVRTTS